MQARTQVLDHLGEGTAISGDAISKFLGHVHIDVLKGQRIRAIADVSFWHRYASYKRIEKGENP